MSKTVGEENSKDELEKVIRQSAKERLHLEKYFAHNCFQLSETILKEFERLKQLEENNLHLVAEMSSFLAEVKAKERSDKKNDLSDLMGDHNSSGNMDIKICLAELEQVNSEHMLLKSTLVQVERECRAAKQQVNDLQKKLQTLETELESMKVSSCQPQSSNNSRIDSFSFAHHRSLRHSTEALEEASGQGRADTESAYQNSIIGLQAKLLELEKKYEVQLLRHEQLTQDMSQLRHQQTTTSPLSTVGLRTVLDDRLAYSSLTEASTNLSNEGPNSIISMASSDLMANFSHMMSNSRQQDNNLQRKASSFQVFVAKYNYDPTRHSPNENPEAELTLSAGDYIFIYDDIDEDGFYDGELMNGKRGLVPSNFIEKVPERDLEDYPGSSLPDTESESMKTSSSFSDSSKADFEESHFVRGKKVTAAEEDLEDILEVDEEIVTSENADVVVLEQPDTAVQDIPIPVDLMVERQLLNSLLISWSASQCQTVSSIQSYSVYLNGLLKASVKAKDRTKALLEKVDLSRSHQISVRAVTEYGQSKDQQCIISVGKGVTPTPTDFQVSNIASTSAVISWIPSNSNWSHVVTVNNRNRTVINAGGYRCLITGLACDAHHTVSLQPLFDLDSQSLKSELVSLSFKTLPSEIPDAPADVQIEAGPKQGTLLVMWLPIKPDGKPPNSAVTGYSVYVDGKRVKDLPSPTGDHVLLESEDFSTVLNPQQITIRSTTATKESDDSSPISLTPQLLTEVKQLVDPVTTAVQSFQDQKADLIPSFNPASETAILLENSTLPVKQSQTSDPSNYASSQRSDQVLIKTMSMGSHLHDSSQLVNPGIVESGFSAQQLSPLEMKFNSSSEKTTEVFNGYEVKNNQGIKSTQIHRTSPSTGIGPPYGTLPLIEVTKDNSGSFSDSSFDVDVDEPMDRRRSGNNAKYVHSNTVAHQQTSSIEMNPRTPVSGRKKTGQERSHGSGRHTTSSLYGGGYSQDEISTRKSELNRERISTSRLTGNDIKGKNVTSKQRIFIALFSYDPATMSPNPDGVDEELPFKEGQLIKIIRDKDADGFYLGEAGGLCGLVPSNMISEVEDPSVSARNLQDPHDSISSRPFSGTGAGAGADTGLPPEMESLTRTIAPSGKHRHSKQTANKNQRAESVDATSGYHTTASSRRMVALYSYESQHKSGEINNEGELTFKVGDIVMVYGDPDKNGLLRVERNGLHDLVPSEYFRDTSPAELAGLEKRSRHNSGRGNKEPVDQQSTKFGRTNHDKITKSHKHRTRDDTQQQLETQYQRELEQTNINSDIRNQSRHYNQIYSGNGSDLTHRNNRN